MNLTQDDAGSERGVTVGEEIVVALGENPTTGYRWHPDVDESRLRLTADTYEGPQRPVGAGGTRRFTFATLATGTTRLRLVKRRSWEDDAVADFDVTLQITG